MLSPIQERVAALVAELPEARGFALAGGAALIVHGVVERTTSDLDFFCTDVENLAALLPRLEAALADARFEVSRRQVSETFVRLVVRHGADETTIDLASDYRLLPAVETPLGPALSEEELAADKLLALYTRAQARDFTDVYHLARRVGFERMCLLAAAKDPGFALEHLADALTTFERYDPADLRVDADTFAALSRWVAELRAGLAPPTRRPEPPGLSL